MVQVDVGIKLLLAAYFSIILDGCRLLGVGKLDLGFGQGARDRADGLARVLHDRPPPHGGHN